MPRRDGPPAGRDRRAASSSSARASRRRRSATRPRVAPARRARDPRLGARRVGGGRRGDRRRPWPPTAGRSSGSCCRRARPRSGWRSSRTRRASWPACAPSAASRSSRSAAARSATRPGFLAATLAPRRAADPRPDDARRPDRLVDRRQDRGRPARGQEPRRRVPPAGRGRHRHRLPPVPARAPAPGGPRRGGEDGGARRRAAVRAARGATARRSPRGDDAAFDSGAVAEVVERAAWAKVEVVTADEREQGAAGGRIALNLGPLARPRGRGGRRVRRPAPRRGGRRTGCGRRSGSGRSSGSRRPSGPSGSRALLTTPRARRRRRCPTRSTPCSAALATDKKHARRQPALGPADGRRLRRPRRTSPPELVERVAAALLAPVEPAGGRHDPRPRPPGPEPQPARDARAGDLRPRLARRHPRRDRRAGGRARARGRLLPVEPRGRPDRPAARARFRRRDRQRRRADPHVGRAARRAARGPAAVLGGPPVGSRRRASRSGRSTSSTTSRSSRSSGRASAGYLLALEAIARRGSRRRPVAERRRQRRDRRSCAGCGAGSTRSIGGSWGC